MSMDVAVVEHHEMFAEMLELALSLHGHRVHRVPLPAGGPWGESLAGAVLARRPGAALVDLDADPDGDVSRVLVPVVRAGVPVVVLTASRSTARWGECLHHGAARVLPKTAPLRAVVGTLGRLENGLPVTPRDQREALVAAWRRDRSVERTARARLASLSRREREVLGHLLAGRRVCDIAEVDVVSPATVRSQVKAILAKLEVGSQVAAVGMAHRVGWRAPQPVPA